MIWVFYSVVVKHNLSTKQIFSIRNEACHHSSKSGYPLSLILIHADLMIDYL